MMNLMYFISLTLLLMCVFCAGCAHINFNADIKEPIGLSFEAIIVQNPEKSKMFYCRPLFRKGTAEGSTASRYSDMAAFKKPVVLIGKLKNREEMQNELILCGLMEPLIAGKGIVPPAGEMVMRLPLLDMRKPITISQNDSGKMEFDGMPEGLPRKISVRLEPDESLLLAWFDKNYQLTLVRWTRVKMVNINVNGDKQ